MEGRGKDSKGKKAQEPVMSHPLMLVVALCDLHKTLSKLSFFASFLLFRNRKVNSVKEDVKRSPPRLSPVNCLDVVCGWK